MRAKRSAASPDASARSQAARASATRCEEPADDEQLGRREPSSPRAGAARAPSGPPSPTRYAIASRTSTAFPAVVPSTSFMSVRIAVVRHPAPFATATMLSASARAPSTVVMKAPLPYVTSWTRPARPAASFLDRIDDVIRGMLSTVAVTSRMA